MENYGKDFTKFAMSEGISSLSLHNYSNIYNGSISPSILEERKLNVTQMDIFSRLIMDRIIYLGSSINDTVGNIIQAQLLYLDSVNKEDITLYINSGGGSVYSGYSIVDTMDIIDTDVATVCTGMAASMAAIILSNGEKGKRSALKRSRTMIHQPLGGSSGQASDIEIAAREILKIKKELYEILVENTGKSYKQIEIDSDRNFWMTAIEAKEYGIIDEVLTKKK